MREATRFCDGLSLHHYTVSGTWQAKGSATQFGEDAWFVTLQKAQFMDELVTKHSTIMDHYDPERRVAMVVDEWGTWYDVEPGTRPGFLYQQNTLRDALVAGMTLNILNQHGERVRIANIAQTVNVLQSMILTQDEDMLVTPTYHVFGMYKVHHDAELLPVSVDCVDYAYGEETLPAISASASRDAQGQVHLSLCNLDPHRSLSLSCEIRGAAMTEVDGQVLTAEAMQAHNTFEQPDAVKPCSFDGAKIEGERLSVNLPSKSVVVLSLR